MTTPSLIIARSALISTEDRPTSSVASGCDREEEEEEKEEEENMDAPDSSSPELILTEVCDIGMLEQEVTPSPPPRHCSFTHSGPMLHLPGHICPAPPVPSQGRVEQSEREQGEVGDSDRCIA